MDVYPFYPSNFSANNYRKVPAPPVEDAAMRCPIYPVGPVDRTRVESIL